MSRLALHWLDVFTDRPFAGNPLAVVPDADGLSDEHMQAIARRARALRDRLRARRCRAPSDLHAERRAAAGRTPGRGHHRVPRAARAHPRGRRARVPDRRRRDAGRAGRRRGDDDAGAARGGRRARPRRSWPPCSGSSPTSWPGAPRFYSTTGVAQLFAPVRDRETLQAPSARPPARSPRTSRIEVLAAWCEDGSELAQRTFCPRLGIDEDPATGSAAGALARPQGP